MASGGCSLGLDGLETAEGIDMSTLVTALESLLNLAAKQHVQSMDLRRNLQAQESESVSLGTQAATVPYMDGAKTEAETELDQEVQETESHIRRKLIEIHSRLKNGCIPWDEDEDLGLNEDSARGIDGASGLNNLSLRNKATAMDNGSGHSRRDNLLHPDDGGGGGRRGGNNGDEEDDEGTVSDPSPSPQIPINSSAQNYASTAAIGPAKESAVAIIRQCLTIFDPQRDFAEESKALSAQLIAELAKTDVGRSLCLHQTVQLSGTDPEATTVIKSTAKVLTQSSPLETTVQVCRILANLCYNCDEGRRQILENRGCLEMLVQIARGRESRAKASGEDPGQRLPAILPGFLLNFCNGNTDAVRAVGEMGFIGVISDTVISTKTNDAVFNNCLLFLNCLIDEQESHQFFAKESHAVTTALCHVIEHSTSPEVTESALELIQGMTNSSSDGGGETSSSPDQQPLVLSLAKNPNLCKLLMDRIEDRWRQALPDYEEHRKTGCNLLVLILSDDESMKLLFSEGESEYCTKFRQWLQSGDDEMRVCACLCLGNFACSESNSMALVRNGSTEALISLLGQSASVTSGVRLAALGAIKNFVIAAPSRKAVIEQGLIDPIVRLAQSIEATGIHNYSSILKLVGTLRLCTSGNPELVRQVTSSSSSNGSQVIVSKVVEWSTSNESPAQVRDECTRFVGVILKYSHDKEVIRQVIELGGLPSVVMMLHSRHPVMVNEAITSLTLMASVMMEQGTATDNGQSQTPFDYKAQVVSQLHTDAVVNGAKNLLVNPKIPPEMKSNCAVFIQTLLRVQPENFRSMLAEMNFKSECLGDLNSLPSECADLAALL